MSILNKEDDDSHDSEGFVDSPLLIPDNESINVNIKNNPSKSASYSYSLYDIVVINKRKENLISTLLQIAFCLIIIILTPIIQNENFWKFSIKESILDVWLLSSILAIITLFVNYTITLILFSLYGCYIITKTIFYEKYETTNLICFIVMISLTLILFLISLLEKRNTKPIKKDINNTNFDNPWELKDNREEDDLTKSLLEEHTIDDEKSDEISLQVQEANTPKIIEVNEEQREQSISSNGGKKLFNWAITEWKLICIAFISLIIASFCSLAQPFFLGKIISESTAAHGVQKIWNLSITLLIIFIVGSIATFIRSWLFNLVGERLVRKIRVDLFKSIMQQDIFFFDSNKTGELMNRISSDTTVIQSSLGVNLSSGLRSFTQVLVSCILLFITCWTLTLVMLAVVPLLVILAIVYGRYTKKLTKQYQDSLAASADIGNEAITNSRLVKSFYAEIYECNLYAGAIEIAYSKGQDKAKAYGTFMAIFIFFTNFSILVVITYGAILVHNSKLNVGQLISFILYTTYIALGLAEFSSVVAELNNAIGASKRILTIMESQPKVLGQQGVVPKTCKGSVIFDHVNFSYPSRPVKILDDFNLRIEPNEFVALVGPSGVGKSTCLYLLERFYNVTSGEIRIDDYNIENLDSNYLHNVCSIVSQEPSLTSGTIVSNIAFSRLSQNLPFTKEEIIETAKKANAHDFIIAFPDGYDTIVGEKGIQISGGQKQRIAIARALLSKPKIMLLDEYSSSLDSVSEHLIQQSLENLRSELTIIIVAHRLSTVKSADKIVVLSDSRVTDIGTHDDLLKGSEIYRKLVKNQLTNSANDNE